MPKLDENRSELPDNRGKSLLAHTLIPGELHRELVQFCRASDQSASRVMRVALRAYLASEAAK